MTHYVHYPNTRTSISYGDVLDDVIRDACDYGIKMPFQRITIVPQELGIIEYQLSANNGYYECHVSCDFTHDIVINRHTSCSFVHDN